jgi:RND family efflux transporter MFP subunit
MNALAEPRFQRIATKAIEMPNARLAPILASTFARAAIQVWSVCSLVFAVIFLTGCQPNGAAKANKNPKVVITYPVVGQVVDFHDFTGRFEAVKAVDIRSRVSGYVMETPFKDGDAVRKGALLFQIDPRPFEADLNQADANLLVARAEQNLQAKNLVRADRLLKTMAIANEEYDAIQAALEKAKSNVGAMIAARDKAQLYLDYTRVLSPVTGRVSRRYVDPGNLILADNTVLTSVVTEDPMFGYFDVDERSYHEILESIAPGAKTWPDNANLPVLVALANNSETFDRVGYIDFVDNRVVATTGTVRMRGVFDNHDGFLKAGFFIRVRLPMGKPYRATVIPDEAVQNDQERKFVWIVNDKNEVEYRSVQLGQSLREYRVIKPAEKGKDGKEGLALSDRVIVNGMQRVRKGIVVDAETQQTAALPENPMIHMLETFTPPKGAATVAVKDAAPR